MKKRLLIALSLILAALLLLVACDDAPKTPNESVDVPGDLDNNKPGSEDSTNEPESTPSEEIIEITKEPEEPAAEDLAIFSTLFGEAKGFIGTEQAQNIAFDLLTAVGEKGIELNGEKYSMAVFGDINTMTLTASVSFDNATFAELTLNGNLTLIIGPNKENETREVGSSEDPQLPFKIATEGDGITFSINSEDMIIDSVEDLISEDFETFIYKNQEALLNVVNAFIPNLIESYNKAFENYEVSTDLLSIVISEKISGDIALIKGSGFTTKEGLMLDGKFTASTKEPLEYNGSKYGIIAKGNANIKVNRNLDYDPEYLPSAEGEIDNSKLYPVTITGKVLFDVEIITSGKVGDNKIQIQAQLSDEIEDMAIYVVINEKVLDLKDLISPEAE